MSQAFSTASIKAGISFGLEQMHGAFVTWQPEAWMAARRAGRAHVGRPAEIKSLLVVTAGAGFGEAATKGRAKARRTFGQALRTRIELAFQTAERICGFA